MNRLAKVCGGLVLALFTTLIGYEAFAVLKAREQTPALFQELLSRGLPIEAGDLPPERLNQLLQVEDPNFYQHPGIDLCTPGAGLTTLTQAMVKYLYFDRFRPGFMKIEQSLIAWLAVDALIDKQTQLTVFLNTAYLGHVDGVEIRGFATAAEAYFGKGFQALSEEEYLSLVAMLIGPNEFSIRTHPERNRERVQRIRKLLSGEYRPHGNRDVHYDYQGKGEHT